MIKNPTHLQKVYFLEEDQIKSGQITYAFEGDKKTLPSVEISNWYHRFVNQIYETKEEAKLAAIPRIIKRINDEQKSLFKRNCKLEKQKEKLQKLLK